MLMVMFLFSIIIINNRTHLSVPYHHHLPFLLILTYCNYFLCALSVPVYPCVRITHCTYTHDAFLLSILSFMIHLFRSIV